MSVYVVTLLACLASPPGDCVGQALALPGISNETACVVAARLAVREWRKEHPGMKVLQAKCEARPPVAAAQDPGRGA